jgi:predicted nucleotidyltransferase
LLLESTTFAYNLRYPGQYLDFKAGLERVLDRPVDMVELAAMQESRLKRMIERTQVGVYEAGV